MSITFSQDTIDFSLNDESRLKNWITRIILDAGKRVGKISYFFCDDKYLLGVNQKFLDHDTYTDIITFDYVECGRIAGDILISVERVADNAAKFGVPLSRSCTGSLFTVFYTFWAKVTKQNRRLPKCELRRNRLLLFGIQ